MAVTVSFVTSAAGQSNGPGIGIWRVRAMEVIAVGATTTTTALDGEFIVIGNAESDMIRAAKGSTPDADATAETSATSAGFPIGAGQVSDPVIATVGDKINVELAD
jgi:hypothetical protein